MSQALGKVEDYISSLIGQFSSLSDAYLESRTAVSRWLYAMQVRSQVLKSYIFYEIEQLRLLSVRGVQDYALGAITKCVALTCLSKKKREDILGGVVTADEPYAVKYKHYRRICLLALEQPEPFGLGKTEDELWNEYRSVDFINVLRLKIENFKLKKRLDPAISRWHTVFTISL